MTIAENLVHLRDLIHAYELRYNRPPHSVKLLAASKSQPIALMEQAIAAGQLIYGENYLQPALDKILYFRQKDIPLEWHFLGPVQRNKTKKIAENFSWVHTIDKKIIAERLNDSRPSYLPALNVCIQINISQETSKSGIPLENIFSLAEFCVGLPRLSLRGLMTIPSIKTDLNEQRSDFLTIKKTYDTLQKQGFAIDTLSMGMSNDLEAAIAEGATLVRIGTALFGRRKP